MCKKFFIIGAVVVLMTSVLSGCACNKDSSNPETVFVTSEERDKITVSSSKSVNTVPDMAEVDISLVTYGESADDVQKELSERSDKLISVLKENGIEEKDISTENYSIWPRYDYSDDIEEIIGYEANSYLKIKNQKIKDVGNLINICTENGVDSINDIIFSCSNYDEVYAEALAGAVKDAKIKADVIASAQGKTVGNVIEITEGYHDTSYQYMNSDSFIMMDKVYNGAENSSILPGEAGIDANVVVSFELN